MSKGEPATSVGQPRETEVGSVFVSNYPPYSFWSGEQEDEVRAALDAPPSRETPLGLYLHIPFCRKRCKFCYFRVYTDKNAADVGRYVDALVNEIRLYSPTPAVTGRALDFVYVGGGTPSYISVRHLKSLIRRLRESMSWDDVKEITFECEPGTLTRARLEAIREVGVTRLSLGIENFNDEILAENGRAHVSKEIFRVLPWIRDLAFDQLNIDLIAGMIGESWDTWRETVRKAVDTDADSVTIYQMELPYNTVYSRQLQDGSKLGAADWATKRAWHDHAFERLEAAGYEISSAYTVVKPAKGCRFVYRDSLWHGSDMLGLGVSSFSHLGGVHFQNLSGWDAYLDRVESGKPAVERAFRTSPRERLTREMILQLKLGRIRPDYFKEKFGVDILDGFAEAFAALEKRRMLEIGRDEIHLTREGLLRVDQLLPEFYAPEYRDARYT